MNKAYLNRGKRYEATQKLCDDARDLVKSVWSEYDRDGEDDTYHDWDFLTWRLYECDLYPLMRNILAEDSYAYLNGMIHRNIADEKMQFEAEKVYRDYVRYDVLPHVENLIYTAKNMKFNDYRVQRFQLRLGEVMQELKTVYDQILGDDEES